LSGVTVVFYSIGVVTVRRNLIIIIIIIICYYFSFLFYGRRKEETSAFQGCCATGLLLPHERRLISHRNTVVSRFGFIV
jgi:hypothetical protein